MLQKLFLTKCATKTCPVMLLTVKYNKKIVVHY